MNDESLDQAVYRRLSRLLDEQAGGVMIGDLCDSFRPPLEGPLAWAVVRRLEKARLVWVSTLHGVVALSIYAHDQTQRKRHQCQDRDTLSTRQRTRAELQELRLRKSAIGGPPKRRPGGRMASWITSRLLVFVRAARAIARLS